MTEDRNLYGFPCPAVSAEEAMALRQLADSLSECALSYERAAESQPSQRSHTASVMRIEAMSCRANAALYRSRANQWEAAA